jgi:hypothetical protein
MIRRRRLLGGLPAAARVPLVVACSGGGGAEPAPQAGATETLPDPAEAGLVTPEEAARTAEESIDASNAESELERLQREIERG